MPPGKAYKLRTRKSEPAQEKLCKSNRPYVYLCCYFFKHILGVMTPYVRSKSYKWRQRPDMTMAVDWDAKPQLKQT